MPILKLVPLRALATSLILAAPVLPAVCAAGETSPANVAWIAEVQRYATQDHLQNDQPYWADAKTAPKLPLSELLNHLPDPSAWPQLRHDLAAAAAQAPAGPERQRLQAGSWLLAYLSGDQAALLAELPASGDESVTTPAAYALSRLRLSLERRETGEATPAQQVEQFERQLIELEPLKADDVKQLLGGEENFARVQRLVDGGKELQKKMAVLWEEYQTSKDEAAGKEKTAQLFKEFEAQYGADEKALEPFRNHPVLRRYMQSLYSAGQEPHSQYKPQVTVPDLVTAVGPERAEALLRRALRLPLMLEVNGHTGEATLKLVRRVMLAEIDTLQAPSWGLVHATDTGELFAALLKRFPPTGDEEDYEYQQAAGYYLAALIEQGRVPEAVTFATEARMVKRLAVPYPVMNALEEGGRAPELWEFLRLWLTRHPAADEWDRFNRLSAQLNRLDELRSLIRELAANGSLNGLDRLEAQIMQAGIELASDDLPAAARRLQTVVEPVAGTPEERKGQFDVAIKLLRLAGLQEDPPAFARALKSAEAILAAGWNDESDGGFGQAATLTSALNSFGHFEDAIRVSRAALDRIPVQAAKPKAAEESGDAATNPAGDDDRARASLPEYALKYLLGEQLRALVELGRWPEAGKLVSGSPWWGAKDVNELLLDNVTSNGKPLSFYFAQVARHEKRDAVIRPLLEGALVAQPGADWLYQDYIDLVGRDARPLLAKLLASDRYQERPLIWRAKLEIDAKQWDQAIATLQEAIGIDPSDGEEGRGDRMRVYAYMSLAQAGKGDKAKADFFADVVKAIRLSETADRWFEIGAYAHAIALYRQALGFFQDAYCIQSRLAVRLAGEGKVDEAAEHYRKAFELMPDSFGRVESHCFGCEHVFAGKKSQGVAEQVFTQMLQARPDKPQLHYLLGYLREEQEEYTEAAEHYRRAVKLDPLYLNAWNKLAGLQRNLKFTPAQRDELSFKLLELDPLRRHVSPSLGEISDVPQLWRAMRAASRVLAELPKNGPLWELKASAAQKGTQPGSYATWRERESDFGSLLAQRDFVRSLQAYWISLAQPEQ